MKKSILDLKGTKVLTRKEQKHVNGAIKFGCILALPEITIGGVEIPCPAGYNFVQKLRNMNYCCPA